MCADSGNGEITESWAIIDTLAGMFLTNGFSGVTLGASNSPFAAHMMTTAQATDYYSKHVWDLENAPRAARLASQPIDLGPRHAGLPGDAP